MVSQWGRAVEATAPEGAGGEEAGLRSGVYLVGAVGGCSANPARRVMGDERQER